MPTVVTHPLNGLLNGVLQGWGLAQRLKQESRDQQAFERSKAMQEEEASVRHIENTMKLQRAGARPVDDSGAVSDSIEGRMPDEYGDLSADTNPEHMAPLLRKADRSRLVELKDLAGKSQKYELPTEEENLQRHIQDTIAMQHAGSIPIRTPQHLRAQGLPETLYVKPEHMVEYANSSGQLAPVDNPMRSVDPGAPPTIPGRYYGAASTAATAAANRKAADTRADASLKSREDVANKNRTAANTRASDANAARLKTRGATAGQAAVAGRFETRREDAAKKDAKKDLADAQKRIDTIQAKEDAAHAERIQIGQQLSSTELKTEDRRKLESRGTALKFEVQGYQNRKATIAGAALPPKQIRDKMREGESATSPDGHTWELRGGIVYFVK